MLDWWVRDIRRLVRGRNTRPRVSSLSLWFRTLRLFMFQEIVGQWGFSFRIVKIKNDWTM